MRPNLMPVRDQGKRESCLCFAASTAHEHHLAINDYLSVEFLFFHSIQKMPGSCLGAGCSMAAMSVAVRDDGQPHEHEWPYSIQQPDQKDWIPPPTSGAIYMSDTDLTRLSFDQIKVKLDDGVAVICGLRITDDFYTPNGDGRIIDGANSSNLGGHAVLAVGYGVDQSDGEECVLIRNSWGNLWGVQGHGWLGKDYLSRHLLETAIFVEEP